MTLAAGDLGDLGNLAKAVGLIDAHDAFEDDWLSRPEHYLGHVLAETHQRDALMTFIDDLLGGSVRRTDPQGRVWLPLVEIDDPDLSFYLVVDEAPSTHVRVGVGVTVRTSAPVSETSLHVPLFKAAKIGHGVADVILLGTAEGEIAFTTEIVVEAGAPAPGAAHLGRVGLSLGVPTAGTVVPKVVLTLGALQLPGAPSPRDITVASDSIDTLDDLVLELVLGLVEAQAAALPGPLANLAGVLGLRAGSGVPPLPVADFATQGVAALTQWLNGIAGDAAARTAWFGQWAGLLGGGASAAGVTLALGPAAVTLGLDVAAGASGASLLTPRLTAAVAAGGLRAELAADVARIDLGTGEATALPRVSLLAHAGDTGSGGTPLLTGDPAVAGVRVGVALDGLRKPVLVIAAHGVTIAGNEYPFLDLSTPDAIVEGAGTVLGDVVDDLVAQLGAVGDTVRLLLGLSAPAAHPTLPTLDLAAFLADPLTELGRHWRTVLRDHSAAVPDLLDALRGLLGDAGSAASPIRGSGTPADPWRLPLAGAVELGFYGTPPQDRLIVAVTARYVMDTLGERCTRVTTELTVALLALDFAAGAVIVAPEVVVTLTARARGQPRARFRAGPVALSADHIGLAARWSPGPGLQIEALAPNLQAEVARQPIPVALPTFAADGSPQLTPEQWDGVERLLGLLGSQSRIGPFQDLVEALGWIAAGPNLADDPGLSDRPRLRLAGLLGDPAAAVRDWARALLAQRDDYVATGLTVLTRLLTGSDGDLGSLFGAGRPAAPFRLPLVADDLGPSLALWLEPYGPARLLQTRVGDRLRDWRPGLPGLGPAALAEALLEESVLAESLAALVRGRGDIGAGLEALLLRWVGTDGLVVPPAAAPAGITVHHLEDVAAPRLGAAVDLAALLGAAPDVRIHVEVLGSAAPLPWPSAPAERLLDLRAPGLAPESFAVPAGAAGDWFVALGVRAAARLAAGDADGLAGQTARLTRVLGGFGGLGRTALIAGAGAGQAARQAAQAVAAVTDLVTLGTPLGPVSFSILDSAPGGESLRMLLALLPAVDPAEPDDSDLALARDLLESFAALLRAGDPGAELRPPVTPHPPPRAGLNVHAVFGVLSDDTVRRALTAVVAAGLSIRATARAALQQTAAITGAGIGVSLPFRLEGDGLVVEGRAVLETLGFDLAVDGGPALRTGKTLELVLSIDAASGWLVGGPDPARGPGTRPEHELRGVEALVSLPLTAGGRARVELVLVEPRVFDIRRERWVVSAAGIESLDADVVTPALPEVRVLLAQVAGRLAAAGSGPMSTLRQLLAGLGLVDASGGIVADGVEHLVNEPVQHVEGVLADPSYRAELQAALTGLAAPIPGLDIDLAARTLTLVAAGTPGAGGLLPWRLELTVAPGAAPRLDFELEPAAGGIAGGVGVRLDSDPFAVTLLRQRPGAGAETIALWPNPDGAALLGVVARLAPAELARSGLEYLRALDATAQPIVDAAYDALGLLGAVQADGTRVVVLPVELLEDPLGWLGHAGALGAGGSGFALAPAKVIALLDAFKPIVGIAGGPGEWRLASGVAVRARSSGGAAQIALDIDTSAFAAIPTAAGRLVLAGTASLTLPGGAAPQPGLDLALALEDGSGGRQAVHVALGAGLVVYLRPVSGPDISLYPDPPGLASLATVAVGRALPLVLDELTDQTTGTAGDVGAVIAELGDALGLRSGAPARFDGAALEAWAADPAAALATALPGLSAAALNAVAATLGPLLPAPVGAGLAGDTLTVTVGGLRLGVQPAPFQVEVDVDVAGIPGAGRLSFAAVLNDAGLRSLVARVGPGDVDAGGLTLRPYVDVSAGDAPAGGCHVAAGLAFDAAGLRAVAGRWSIDGGALALVAIDGASEHTDPARVALALVEAVVGLLGQFALSTPAVDEVLDTVLTGSGGSRVRDVLRGVFLEDVAAADALDPALFAELFQPAPMLARLKRLLVNVADAGPSIDIGGNLSIGVQTAPASRVVELVLGVNGRFDLSSGDIVVSLEADSRWIRDTPPPGVALGFLNVDTGQFSPVVAANGLGIRFARSGAPLLEAGLSLGSIALHVFGRVSATERAGGVQVQLSDLAVATGGASGGNPVAQGLVADAGSGAERLAPSFSPALAVQKHGADALMLSLRAGDGDGPWWLPIQKGFGPIYIEQVGFDTTADGGRLVDVSLLLDGGVSLAGLAAAVDDLRLTFVVASNASIFDPGRWSVDLAGLAVEADLGGISLAGGLRKFGSGDTVEYIGMLMARFAAYGLSVYGGYGTGVQGGKKFTAFFAFGAINGPIGGPPAFFLTGIGGGLGINRDLIFPSEMNAFNEFVFIRALDPAAAPTGDPMGELIALRDTFPMKRGDFWFAAGISFNSFALVDGIAVVAVKIGDGFELSLLGLARVALPRPQVALVSIELGLIARFSTEEGVLWIQAQLTDNSWLLHESVRLTGGFAFVSWFAGPRAGEFVLTMGGYHPSFHRDGYPIVPRLGFNWQVASAIVIKGENYFALTSEALMAGGKLEASARFGPAWAEVKFGADGIVYFDPFRFEVQVYARIAAGITIDVWIGEITISISLGAHIMVEGPKFRGVATFEVGPVELTVAFGDTQKAPKVYLTWNEFVPKYLEEAAPGVARCITGLPGKGALPPGPGTGGQEQGTADGSAAKPFEVLSEFVFNVTTIVPSQGVKIGADAMSLHAPSRVIGLAPLGEATVDPTMTLRLRDSDGVEHLHQLRATVHRTNGFPVGVWGNPQEDDDRKVPEGEVIDAVDGLVFEAIASVEGSLPREMAYHQVESGERKPLPFFHARADRARYLTDAAAVTGVLPAAGSVEQMYAVARPWLARGGHGDTALAALERERSAPPRLGSLTENLAAGEPAAPDIALPPIVQRGPVDARVRPPRAIAVLTAEIPQERPGLKTTVSDRGRLTAEAPPRLAEVEASVDWSLPAKLLRVTAPAATAERTLLASGTVPFTRGHSQGVAAVARRGAALAGQQRLAALTRALDPSWQRRGAEAGPAPGARAVPRDSTLGRRAADAAERRRARAAALLGEPTLAAGEIAVLRLPNAERDVDPQAPRPRLAASGGRARLLALAAGGRVLLDREIADAGVEVPRGTERLAVLALGQRDAAGAPGLAGWHDLQSLAYVGWGRALVSGACLAAEGGAPGTSRQRFRAGWIPAAALTGAASLLTTRFVVPLQTVVVVLDEARGGPVVERGLSLALDGARRARGADGRERPPVVLATANRALLVYELAADDGAEAAITVSVARQAGFRLAGVLGSTLPADTVVEHLGERGLDRAVQPLTAGRGGQLRLQWHEVAPGGEPPRDPGSGGGRGRRERTAEVS